MKKYFLLSIICATLSGCLVGPNYCPPEICVSDEWHAPYANIEGPDCVWWQLFNDPLLSKYIGLASCYNYDLLQAEANIWQARAVTQVTASDLFPHIAGDLNALRTFFSKNGPIFALGGSRPGLGQALNLYNAVIDASWEIDLFGKTRRSIEASKATAESIIEQRNQLLLSIFAEVAMDYIQIRSAQMQTKLIEENISILEKNAEIVKARFKSGYSNQLDLDQIEAELASAQAALPNLYAEICRGIYALSILTGNLPETFLDELLVEAPLPKPPVDVAVGLRSDLLRRRPDVLEAERQLAAATANIGVAVASFFPSINLLGAYGVQSLHLNNLFEAHSRSWAILGDVNLPIFQGGKLMGNLRASEAAAVAAVANYQQIVLNAIEEAEGTLITYEQERLAQERLKEATNRNAEFAMITDERFKKGLVSMTDYLNAERQLISSELTLLQSDTAVLLDLIALYKALAGPLYPCQEQPVAFEEKLP